MRKLAEQSQQSAKEIYEIVQKIQEDTEGSVQIMVYVNENVIEGVEVSSCFPQVFDFYLRLKLIEHENRLPESPPKV